MSRIAISTSEPDAAPTVELDLPVKKDPDEVTLPEQIDLEEEILPMADPLFTSRNMLLVAIGMVAPFACYGLVSTAVPSVKDSVASIKILEGILEPILLITGGMALAGFLLAKLGDSTPSR